MDKKLLLLAATLGLAACGDNGDSNNNHDYGNRREVTYLEYTGKTESATITPDSYVAIAKAAVEATYHNIQSHNLINFGIHNIKADPFDLGDGNAPVSDSPHFDSPVYHFDYDSVSSNHHVLSDFSGICNGSGDYYYHILSDYSEFHYDYRDFCANELKINDGRLILQQKNYSGYDYLKTTFLSMYIDATSVIDSIGSYYNYGKSYEDIYGSFYSWAEYTENGEENKKRYVIKYMIDGLEDTMSRLETCDTEQCLSEEVFLSQSGYNNKISNSYMEYSVRDVDYAYLNTFDLDISDFGGVSVNADQVYPSMSNKTFCSDSDVILVREKSPTASSNHIRIDFIPGCTQYTIELMDSLGNPTGDSFSVNF